MVNIKQISRTIKSKGASYRGYTIYIIYIYTIYIDKPIKSAPLVEIVSR